VAVFLRQHLLFGAHSGDDAIAHGQCLNHFVIVIDRKNGAAAEDDIRSGSAAASQQQG
jgi:hypothetical protein